MIYYYILALLFQDYSGAFTDFRNKPLEQTFVSDTQVYVVLNSLFCRECVYKIDKFLADYDDIAYFSVSEKADILGNKQTIAALEKLCKPDAFLFRSRETKSKEFDKLLNSHKSPLIIVIKHNYFYFYNYHQLFSPEGDFIGSEKMSTLLGKRRY